MAPWGSNARNGRGSTGKDGCKAKPEAEQAAKAPKPLAPVSVHQSGIDRMHAVGTITDAQKNAADRFRDLWTAAHADGLRGIDYSRPKVDVGSRATMPGTLPNSLAAYDELEAVRLAVGERDFEVLRIAAGLGGTMSDVAAAFGLKSRSQPSAWVKRALAALADHWAATGAGYGIRGDRGPQAGVVA